MFRPTLPLTTDNARAALAEGLRAIGEGADTFDLGAISASDSAGVAILLAWQRAARARNTNLIIRNPQESLRTLAALYGVELLTGMSDPSTRH